MFSYIRDDDGVLTKFKDGSQFVYCYPNTAEISRKHTILEHQCIIYQQETTRSTLTMDLAQLPHPYSVHEDTDPKSQDKHQAGEQQCLTRKDDLPD